MYDVIFVHDWLVSYRGGEKVLQSLLPLFPEAPVFTLFYDPPSMPEAIRDRHIVYPRGLNRLKGMRRGLLPVLPRAVERLSLPPCRLVISTSSCVAKGVMVPDQAKHLCYIHSPMRYVWDQREQYLANLNPIAKPLARKILGRIQRWDVASSQRVDYFVANSSFVAERVKRFYQRESSVIHPPVSVERFAQPPAHPEPDMGPYFLAPGAFVPYKRLDIAVAACQMAGVSLVVMGAGSEEQNLRQQAGNTVKFVVSPDDEAWRSWLYHAEAMLLPAVEDFGISSIEALACGTPLVALRAGGALDYVEEGVTGAFFDEQTAVSLAQTLSGFKRDQFSRETLRDKARYFREDRFLAEMKEAILATGAEVTPA